MVEANFPRGTTKRSTTQITEVTRHQRGMSALIPQTSPGVAKCRLFSRAGWNSTSIFWVPENEGTDQQII